MQRDIGLLNRNDPRKVSIGAQPLESLTDARQTVTFEGVGGWIMAADVVLLLLAGLGVGTVNGAIWVGATSDPVRFLAIGAVCAALLLPIGKIRGEYDPGVVFNLAAQLRALVLTWVGIFLFLLAVAFGLSVDLDLSRAAVVAFGMVGLVLIVANRLCWTLATRRAHAHWLLRTRKVAILEIGSRVSNTLRVDLTHHGYEVARSVKIPVDAEPDDLDTALRNFVHGLRGTGVREIFLQVSTDMLDGIGAILERLRAAPLPVHLVPEPPIAFLVARSWRPVGTSVAIEIQGDRIGVCQPRLKRSLDIIGSGTALLMLSPFLLLVALAIRLESHGRVLVWEPMQGLGAKPLRVLKFRTFATGGRTYAERRGTNDGARITNVGKVLLRTRIGALPGLVNVLWGEMSLVGPRALPARPNNLIELHAMGRHLKPGLTGWAQVNAHRLHAPVSKMMPRELAHDLWYVENWSLWLDVRILLATPRALLRSPMIS